MKHRGTKILSLLLTLVMVLGLMPGMSLTVYADDDPPYAQYKNTTTVVHFDSKDWYLIDYDTTTVTLLAKEYVAASKYNSSGKFVKYSDNPTVKTAVDNYYNNSISTDAKTAVSSGMFLLTYAQAIAITNADVMKCTNNFGLPYNGWWLRTQADALGYNAVIVNGTLGELVTYGFRVDATHGVRPALKLKLSSVIFDSESKSFTLKPAGYSVTYIDNTGANEKREFGPYEAGYEYKIEGGSIFPKVPQGKEFDGWKDSAGNPYTENTPITLNSNLTLYAQWKDASQGGGSQGGQNSQGGGSQGGDVVFYGGFGGGDGWSGGYVTGQRAYRVSLAPMQGGSAILILNTGESGTELSVYPQTTVMVIPSPAPGYRLASIVWSLIDGSASYDITQAQNLVMPAMDVVVHVNFVPVG